MAQVQLPLKSKLPILCGTVLVSEILCFYFALLVGFGLKPVPFGWSVAAAAVLTVLSVLAIVLLPRKAGAQRPGIMLGWIVQVLILASGIVMPAMIVIAVLFGAMWGVAVYWGRRIDREATSWAIEHNAQT